MRININFLLIERSKNDTTADQHYRQDKETILEMMAEFEQTQSARRWIFGMLKALIMRNG